MELWIPFVVATTLILVIPGPTIILVISQSVTHGRKSVIPLVTGVLLGDFTAMTFSLLGLGTLLSASATLFTLFKWAGALYLIYLGIQMLRSAPGSIHSSGSTQMNASAAALFKRSYIVTALNPKSIAFFVAFLPQFIAPAKPLFAQLALLGSTFLILATINAALYAFFAGQLSEYIQKGKIRKWFNRLGGSALVGAGLITASLQRSN
jgi:threonine/homoserine/homoserine lactone efflux protein